MVVSTFHTLFALILPSLLLDLAAGARRDEPPPLACCMMIDRYADDLVQKAAYFRSVERFSERVFVYFCMSFGGSHLYRIGWEYWEHHKMIGWGFLEYCLYSPTALYGTRESVVPLISDYQVCVAFAVINPYLHVLAAGNAILQRYGLAFRNAHFREHARGTVHPGPAEAVALIWPTAFLGVFVMWLVLPAMGVQHALAAMTAWLVLLCFISISSFRVKRLDGLWAKEAEEAWSDEYLAMHKDVRQLAVAEAQRRDFLDLGHSNWRYEDDEPPRQRGGGRRRGGGGEQAEEVLALDHANERQVAASGSNGDAGALPLLTVQEESAPPDAESQQLEPEPEPEQDSTDSTEPGDRLALGALDPNKEPEPVDLASGKVMMFPDGLAREVFTQEEYDQALQVQIPDPDGHFVYPDEDDVWENLDPEEQYLTFKAEHLSRAGTLSTDLKASYHEVVADRKSMEILENTLGPQSMGAGHPLGIEGDVKSYYHTRVPPHARLAKDRHDHMIERPTETGNGLVQAIGGSDGGALVHHPHSTAAEMPLDEALALADAADQTLERLDRYRAGNGGVGPGKGKYARKGALQMPSVSRVLQNVLMPDTTKLMKRGVSARAQAVSGM